MGSSKVKIKSGPIGIDSVELDGEDISDKVGAISVSAGAGPGDLTQIHITTIGETELEVEGAVYIHDGQANQTEAAKGFAEWLESRDPQELETQALALFGMNEEEPFAAKILQILAEMVREASGITD